MKFRWFIRAYFNKKYSRENPYGITQNGKDNRYSDMLNIIRNHHYLRALDVGCGEGMFSYMLSDYCTRIDGIDISENAIKRAKKVHSLPNIYYYVQDIVKADKINRYDLIVFAEILYYLNDMQIQRLFKSLPNILLLNGHLLTGNIKKIGPNSGVFRCVTDDTIISATLNKYGKFELLNELDRGNDVIRLYQYKGPSPTS